MRSFIVKLSWNLGASSGNFSARAKDRDEAVQKALKAAQSAMFVPKNADLAFVSCNAL